MRIAFITRSTLYNDPGGDTVQILQTARQLKELGVTVDVLKTNDPIQYDIYDLLHFFNLSRPADILYHISKRHSPFVISPILVDYSEYDKQHRHGFSGAVLRYFSPAANEYLKTIARWLTGKDILRSKSYIWKGQKKSIRKVLEQASAILPNSDMEYHELTRLYNLKGPCYSIPNGINTKLFIDEKDQVKDEKLLLCVGRIEGRKNQLNLIKAINNSAYTLYIIGSAAANQKKYFETCKKIAARNIVFIDQLPQESLINYYKKAKVHILASWFETCGLSSMEAAAMGCNIVITDKGFTRSYYGNDAFYCEPNDPQSIYNAIERAAKAPPPLLLKKRITTCYTWEIAAMATLAAYKKILTN